MSDKDAELRIGADGSQAEAEFGKVANAAEKAGQRIHQTIREASYNMAASTKAATEQMNGHFAKVTESFGKVNAMLVGFTAILAGGAVFKAGIDETNKLTMEANKLGKQLGITATEAGVLSIALGDVYVETDTMLAANQKLVKTLGTNEQAFKNLGVATRDQNGNFRSSLDIMLDVNKHLLQFKEGVDRNIEGQKIYGKQWGEVQGILKLTTERMEDARKKSEELGLVVGKENVEATANYRAAMNDVGDVLSAMKKVIGDALLPILTDLGNWFSSIGPGAVTVMKGVIGGLASTFYGLKMAVEIVWEVIKVFVQTAAIRLTAFAEAASKALKFDFTGAKAVWRAASNEIADNFDQALNRIIAKAEANRDRMAGLFAKPTATDKKEGGAHSDGGAEKGKSKIGDWKAELEARKEVEGQFFKDSLADDDAFWQAKLAQVKKGSADERAVRHELFVIHKQMAQQKFAEELDNLKADMAAARAGSQERINLAADAARRVGETYGWESQQYRAAIKEIKKAADEFDKEQQKLEVLKVERARDHNLAQIGMERDQLALLKSLGQISDQEEIAALKALEERKYQIEVQALKDKIALMKEEGVARQQQLDELAKLQEKHEADMAKLDGQNILAVKKGWDTMLGAVSGAFEQSLNGMIMGTQTLQKAVANIGQAIVAEFVKLGVKRVTTWISNEMTMTTATVAGVTARGAAEKTGASQSVIVGAMSSVKGILNAAWETLANVYKSISAIPVVGPAMAPAMAAGAFSVVAGAAGNIASAAGGYDIPAGINPLTQLHEKEMVLPAKHADAIRRMADGGKPAPVAPVTNNYVTMNVLTPDADSFRASHDQISADLRGRLNMLSRGV